MDSLSLPVACGLTDAELQERRREVLQKTRRAMTEVREIEDGFMYRFSSDAVKKMQLLFLFLILVVPYVILTLAGRWVTGFKIAPAQRARVGLTE